MLQNMQWFKTWKKLSQFSTTDDVRHFLEEVAGFRQLGSGAFSVVFALDDDWVVKVTKKRDVSSYTYLRWCMRNQGVQGVPEILAMHKFGSGIFAVVMRRYIKYDDAYVSDEAQDFINAVKQGLGWVGKACSNMIEGGNGWLDLHKGNYMFDNGGRVFITDPIAF